MVLGGGANHGRPANVDVLNGQGVGDFRLGDGVGKGIEVDDDQIDGGDAMGGHHLAIGRPAPEDAAMNLRMQGLHPPVHDFREAGVIGHFGHRQARLGNRPAGAAGGEEVDAEFPQTSGQFHQAGLVGHAEQGEFGVHHQPIVNREGNEIVTCAAAAPGWGMFSVTGWAVSGASRRRRASRSACGGSESM